MRPAEPRVAHEAGLASHHARWPPQPKSPLTINGGLGVEGSLPQLEEDHLEAIVSKKLRKIDENPKREKMDFLGS